MLLYTYKGLMILYSKYQLTLLKNIIKQNDKDIQALKKALNDNNIETY